MSRTALFLSLCTWPLTACGAHHDSRSDDDPADASDAASFADSDSDSDSDSAEGASCDADFDEEDAEAAAGSGVAASPFLGSWTLTGTSAQQCPTLSIVAPYSALVNFEPVPSEAEAGSDQVLFDTGLGCSLVLSVEGSVARLSAGPTLCGTVGTPPDLEFMSIEITAGESSAQITETLTGACSWTIQGTLSR